jgi:multidrug efflux pump subunit AcrA (membrane-fusion protein)
VKQVETPRQADPKRPGRRAYFLVTLFAVLLVLFPFLFWHGTWFGRSLRDSEIDSYLDNFRDKPRNAQHAVVQIGERIGRGDAAARRWYPKLIETASSQSLELRQTAAWLMGQDHTYEPFHDALRKLLADPSLMVRRNAALSLSNFHDDAALPELRAMLRPASIPAPAAGVVKFRLKEGEYVNPGTLVARVGDIEVRSPLPGEVRALSIRDGSEVKPGDALADISVDKEHVWEALRALHTIGRSDDLEDVQRYARGVPGMPEKVQQQAALTLQEIQGRAK